MQGAQALVRAAHFLVPERTLSVALEPTGRAEAEQHEGKKTTIASTTSTTSTSSTSLEVSLLGARRVRSILVNGSATASWNETAGGIAVVSLGSLPGGLTTVDIAVE